MRTYAKTKNIYKNKLIKQNKKTKMSENFKFGLVTYIVIVSILSMLCFSSVYLSGNLNTSKITVGATTLQMKIAQAKLSELGYYDGEINGSYGISTRDAILSFQIEQNLTQTGVLDTVTAQALGASGDSQSNYDLYLLAKLIHSEARGEPYTGQVAVGAVVLNRVNSPQFPNTLSGVIYQPWAFTAVNDGQINLEPNSESYQAATDALNGWDPSYGSLYYYNPTTATSQWIFSRTTVVVIGNHVFAI